MCIRILMAILLTATCAFGQGLVGSSASAPQQPSIVTSSDPQALAALAQALQAAGGAQALGAIQDFTATGQITYSWAGNPDQGAVTLRARGLDQFRLDATLPEGTRSWVVSHGRGSLRETDGTESKISGHNAISLGSLTFPYLPLIAASLSSTTTVSTVGNVQVNGASAVQIRVQRHYPSSYDPNGLIAQLTTRDFFIDPTTSLILKAEQMTHPQETLTVSLPEDIYYSSYRAVNGVMVPFTITETVNGQQIWTIQLNTIQFNTGLTDADFSL